MRCRAPGVRVPSFGFPEQAAIALAHARSYGGVAARGRQARSSGFPGSAADEAAAVIAQALEREEGWLEPDEVPRCSTATACPSRARLESSTAGRAAAAAARRCTPGRAQGGRAAAQDGGRRGRGSDSPADEVAAAAGRCASASDGARRAFEGSWCRRWSTAASRCSSA